MNSTEHAARPLPFRQRADLIVVPGVHGSAYWTVKDPLTERFYQLRDVEYFVWRQLDGRVTPSELCQRFYGTFAPQRLSASQLMQFVQQLWTQGLVLLEQSGDCVAWQQLAAPVESLQSGVGWLQNPLAIRFRGVDPDRFLSAVKPFVAWIFSAPMVVVSLLFVFVTAIAVVSDLPLLLRELRMYPALVQHSLPWVLLAVAAVKVLHELGHAFACKRQGGECRELGVMFLLGMPCLYCNVSDAWLLPNRWKRAAIGAAGIYVEVVLAAVAAWVWLTTVPGTVHLLALHVLLICSINTLLLNGNPLLRYDGYYVLADVLNIPNLRSRALGMLESVIAWLLWGLPFSARQATTSSERSLLLTYGLLSAVYLWMVLFSILGVFYAWLAPWGLTPLVIAAGICVVGLRLVGLGRRALRMASLSLSMAEATAGATASPLIRIGRLARVSLGTLVPVLLLVAGCYLPWPRAIVATARTVPDRQETLYVTTPGLWNRITSDVPKTGNFVPAGTLLCELQNLDLNREQIELLGQQEQAKRRLESLENRVSREPHLVPQLAATQALLVELEERLTRKSEQLQRLKLHTTTAGEVLMLQRQQPPVLHGRLPIRSCSPQASRADQLWLSAGEELAKIGSLDRAVVVYVQQSELVELTVGQPVRLSFPQFPFATWQGEIDEISARPLESVPEALKQSGHLPLQATASGLQFAFPVHEIRVTLDHAGSSNLKLNALGTARIDLPSQPIWRQVVNAARETFLVSE